MSTKSGEYQGEKMFALLTGKAVYLAPAAAAANTLKAATNITALTQSLTPTAQPVVPRNVTLTVVDTTSSLTGGTMVVVGQDADGKSVSETHVYTVPGIYTGSVAFSKVSAVNCVFTGALTAPGDETVSIGVGDKHAVPVGISGKLVEVFKALHNNADEAVGAVDKVNATVTPTSASGADHNQEFWYNYKVPASAE